MPRRPGASLPADEPLPPVHLARHVDPSLAAAHLRSGRWVRVRRGAYVDVDHLRGDRARALALARIAALGSQLTIDHVVTHESAALLWRLPVLRVPERTHVAQARPSRSGCSADVVRHVLELAAGDRTLHCGRAVTTLERTVVDCAMSCPPAAGLVVADAALHRGADLAVCLQLLTTMAGRRGVVRARAVLDVADDGAESPGETLARLAVLRAGLPAPTTQVPVRTALGTFWADLGWPAWRLLLEYDGVAKYDVGRVALLAEKRREDALRAEGWAVLRVMADDTRSPERLLRRVQPFIPPTERRQLTPRFALL
ncbi:MULTISPECIES: hypothetical protein [unclassified Actinotalea]|uniref:hypothetical protein n=1 Tax=unclassified Actinotalea TaxID=2638618 RepID=UPI0015F5B3B3|nr:MULTISPECIES: hypothetical protein [unclassified Actinotalea]